MVDGFRIKSNFKIFFVKIENPLSALKALSRIVLTFFTVTLIYCWLFQSI